MTRLFGWLTLLSAYAAILLGMAPWLFLPPKWPLLAAVGVAVFFACCWMVAAWRGDRRRAVDDDAEGETANLRPSPGFARVLGFTAVLASGAALAQGIGPDGEAAEWAAKVQRAGGGTYAATVDKVVGRPAGTGVNINDVDQYATTVVITVPFSEGPRPVTVQGVRTRGKPEPGDTASVMYAPGRPDLGVRDSPAGFWDNGIYLIFIWGWTLVVASGTAAYLGDEADDVARTRRFRAMVHLPALLILLCGVALLLPLTLGFPPTLTGWLLAIAAAATPGLALLWLLKARPAGASGTR